jgi:hypothetical protein
MSTRSRIGYTNNDGSIVSAYCHYDGYPQHNGKILLESYKTLGKVKELVNGGDMSVLRSRCDKPEGHTFEKPHTGATVYYGRDRGEKNVEARISNSKDDFVLLAEGSWGEYAYLFENGKWIFCSVGDGKFDELSVETCK